MTTTATRISLVLAVLLSGCMVEVHEGGVPECEREQLVGEQADECGLVGRTYQEALGRWKARHRSVVGCEDMPEVHLVGDGKEFFRCGPSHVGGCHHQGKVWVAWDHFDDSVVRHVLLNSFEHYLEFCRGLAPQEPQCDRVHSSADEI